MKAPTLLEGNRTGWAPSAPATWSGFQPFVIATLVAVCRGDWNGCRSGHPDLEVPVLVTG